MFLKLYISTILLKIFEKYLFVSNKYVLKVAITK